MKIAVNRFNQLIVEGLPKVYSKNYALKKQKELFEIGIKTEIINYADLPNRITLDKVQINDG